MTEESETEADQKKTPLLCRVHIHFWEYTGRVNQAGEHQRYCKRCKRVQWRG